VVGGAGPASAAAGAGLRGSGRRGRRLMKNGRGGKRLQRGVVGRNKKIPPPMTVSGISRQGVIMEALSALPPKADKSNFFPHRTPKEPGALAIFEKVRGLL